MNHHSPSISDTQDPNEKYDCEYHNVDAPPVANVGESIIYTCPMHPEVQQTTPGDCPKCGMALEPMMPSLEEEENPELIDFRRRFWWTLPLTVIVAVLAMATHGLLSRETGVLKSAGLVLSLPQTPPTRLRGLTSTLREPCRCNWASRDH